MTADTFDSVLGLIEQATGNNNNSWGTTFNNSMTTPVAQAIAGVNPISTTGGTTDLSTVTPPAGKRLDLHHIQNITGALTSDATIKVVNISKTWKFWNNTTGAFNVFVQVPGGVARTGPNAPGGLVQIPQGCLVEVVCDGNGNLMRMDDRDIGSFTHSGKVAAGPGELACNGASLLIAEYPDLYGKIAKTWGSVDSLHFTLPLLTDTNRYLRAGGGSGPAVGTYQANQNLSHTHPGAAFSGTTSGQSADHSHTGSGSTGSENLNHFHTMNGGAVFTVGSSSVGNGPSSPGAAGPAVTISPSTGIESAAHQHAYAFTTSGVSVDHSHTFAGTTGTVPAAGGSEARPESAAVLICIRY